jgi:hypothetical protein
MTSVLISDPRRGASLRNMIDHLSGPLAAGAVESEVAISATGVADVTFSAREPLLLIAPRADLGAAGLIVTATIGAVTERIVFAPFSEAGGFLPVHRPVVDPLTRHAAPFSVTLSFAFDPPAAGATAATVAPTFELRLVEGVMVRMLYVLAAEKARLRREARRLAASRHLDYALLDALDRIGADLAVPRFVESHETGGRVVLDRESDADYARRLRLFRPWLRPNRARVLELLNGPGGPADPNAGLLSQLGLAERFGLAEGDEPFSVSILLVGAGDALARQHFLDYVRATHLVFPKTTAASNSAHAARYLPRSRAEHEDELRTEMRDLFGFSGDAASDPSIAPLLAAALIRAGRCRLALGLAGKWDLVRAQKDDGGSRYELGLGVDVAPFTATELNAMRSNHATANPADPEIRGVLATMKPVPAAQDPDGRWLLEACGLRTVHRIAAARLYLSHLPAGGLTVSGPAQVPVRGWAIVQNGYFGQRRFSGDLLFYDRDAGFGAFYGTDLQNGMLTELHTYGGWRKTWAAILRGRFAQDSMPINGLLFYDGANGDFEAYRAGGANMSLAGVGTTRATWSILVTCPLGRTYDSVFAYDRAAGDAEFLATNGVGVMTRIGHTITGLRQSWSHIVAGHFGGSGTLDLLLYDGTNGDAQLVTTDGNGSFVPFAEARWDDRWTHVVAGPPSEEAPLHDVILYDARTGVAEVRRPDAYGQLKLLKRHENLPQGWTHVLLGDHGGHMRLTFYNRVTGTGELHEVFEDGDLTRIQLYSGWRRSDGTQFEARFEAPGEPGTDVVLANGLAAAGSAWTAAGNPPWTVRTATSAPTQQTLWGQAIAPTAAARTAFGAAELPVVEDPAALVAPLSAVPAELVRTLELPAPIATQILGGSAAGGAKLRELANLLRTNAIAAAIPLRTSGNGLIVVASVVGLPRVGANLTEQPSTGFRWYVVPLQGQGGQVRAIGSRTEFHPAGEGLAALVVIGYTRSGSPDPYEYRVDLPDGVLLDLPQYEFLMNLLDHSHPLGIRVNTFAIRKGHVDLDGDGAADALDANVSRTYRTFRRRRHLGATATTFDKE